MEYGDYEATIEADGYTTATEELAFRSNHKNFTVALESASGTGTVTITCEFDDGIPNKNITAYLSTTPLTEPPSEPTDIVGYYDGSGADPFQLPFFDTQTLQPSGYDIPFGSYYLLVKHTIYSMKYTGELTVDGDEEITVTLTE